MSETRRFTGGERRASDSVVTRMRSESNGARLQPDRQLALAVLPLGPVVQLPFSHGGGSTSPAGDALTVVSTQGDTDAFKQCGHQHRG